MMKRIAPIILACALLSGAAASAAGPVAVTAGEHGSYSRIVLSGGARGASVDETGRVIDVSLASDISAVDLSDVNDSRKAHRVVSASKIDGAEGPIVRIQLNCACAVRTKRLASGKFIVDIADNPRPAPAPSREASAPEEPAEAVDDVSMEEARNKMIELLQQAANEGLITIRNEKREAAAPATPPRIASTEKPAAPPAKAGSPASAVRADRSCLPDSAFEIEAARFAEKPLVAISELQGELASASDDARNEAVEALADGYLSIGFGDEALGLYEQYGMGDTPHAEMARIVAEREIDKDGPILGARGCSGAHALWRAAAVEPEQAAAAAARSGDAVNALPKRLKADLSARIAKKLVLAGAWDGARHFFGIASEANETPTDELTFVAAKLLDHDGETDKAEEMLKTLAAGDSQAAKDALLDLARRYAKGEKPYDGFVDDIGALALAQKGTAIGAEAAYHEAMMWSEAGKIEASLMLLQNAAESGFDEKGAPARAARHILAEAFASDETEDQVQALAAYLEHKNFVDSAGEDMRFLRHAAATASALGLPNAALQILEGRSASQDREDALVAAHAALAAGDGEQALAAAAPYADDPKFAAILVDANLQLERGHAALATASAVKDPGAKAFLVARAAWRAGDWANAVRAFHELDPGVMSAEAAQHFALAAYMAGERSMPPAADAVLKKAKSPSLEGLEGLFAPAPSGPILDRSRSLVDSAGEDLKVIEEMLGHG